MISLVVAYSPVSTAARRIAICSTVREILSLWICATAPPNLGSGLYSPHPRLATRTFAPGSNLAWLRRGEAADLRRVEHIPGATEFAGDGGDPLLGHVVEFVCREGAQDGLDPLARAAAARFDRVRVVDAHAVLVKQPEQQPVRRQPGVDQFA